ncbi:MAG: penicillin-insensitive murein endopeptidase [Polyangiaceae bacterium]
MSDEALRASAPRALLATAFALLLGACRSEGRVAVAAATLEPTVAVVVADAEPSAPSPASPGDEPTLESLAGAAAEARAAPCPREPPLVIESRADATDEEIQRMVADPRARVASAVIGGPARGALYGAIELPESDAIQHAGGYAWGTANTVHAIERAVRQVRACFPDTPRLFVGDLSREHGGGLSPHASHQAGLDADIGYFYRTPPLWYMRATAQNLDVPRTRALVRALIEGGNIEMIFMDRSVQWLIRRQKGESPGPDVPDDDWFESPLHRDALIRHAWGHATHLHARFKDADAVALGARLVGLLPPLHPLRRLVPGAWKLAPTFASR